MRTAAKENAIEYIFLKVTEYQEIPLMTISTPVFNDFLQKTVFQKDGALQSKSDERFLI